MDELLAQIAATALESIPEPFRAFYKPVEGLDDVLRLRVKAVDDVALEDIGGLTATLTERREKHRIASTKLQGVTSALGDDIAFEDLPSVLSDYRKWKATPPGSGSKTAATETEIEERVNRLVGEKSTEWETEKATLTGERDGAFKQLDLHLRTGVATSALLKNKGNVDLMLPHVLPHIGVLVDEATGERSAVVLDSKGAPAEHLKDGKITLVDPVEFVESHFKKSESFGSGFVGTNVAGSGSRTTPPGGGPASGVNPFAQPTFNLTEVSRLVKENPAEAKRFKSLAENAGNLHPACKRLTIK